MSDRIREKHAIPAQLIAISDSRTLLYAELSRFRNFYAIPGGDVDLTQEMPLKLGSERLWRASNVGGRMGRLILPGEFVGTFTDETINDDEAENA